MSAKVDFYGVTSTASSSLCVSATSRIQRVDLSANLRDASVKPKATLKTWCSLHLPGKDAKVTTPPRDRLNTRREVGHGKAMTLSYSFAVYGTKPSKVSFHPEAPICDLLYENPFESQLVTVFDANGKTVHYSDAWPEHYVGSLKPGKYAVKLDLRHRDAGVLEKAKNATMTIRRNLSQSIAVPVHKTLAAAISGSSWGSRAVLLKKGASLPLFVGLPSDVSKSVAKEFGQVNAKDAVAHSLLGEMTFLASSGVGGGGDAPPSKVRLEVTMPGTCRDAAGSDGGGGKDGTETSLEDRLRDARIAYLKQLGKAAEKCVGKVAGGSDAETKEASPSKSEEKAEDTEGKYEDFLREMLATNPKHVPLLSAAMCHREACWRKSLKAAEDERKKRYEAVLLAADRVVDAIDIPKLTQHFGYQNQPLEPSDEDKKTSREMDRTKTQLHDALLLKCAVLAEDKSATEAYDASLVSLQRWADLKSPPYVLVLANRARATGRRGTELKHLAAMLSKPLSSRKSSELSDKAIRKRQRECYEALHWDAVVHFENARLIADSPPSEK